jgi:hypothetical protein
MIMREDEILGILDKQPTAAKDDKQPTAAKDLDKQPVAAKKAS